METTNKCGMNNRTGSNKNDFNNKMLGANNLIESASPRCQTRGVAAFEQKRLCSMHKQIRLMKPKRIWS